MVSHKHVKNTIYRKRFKTKDKNEVYMYKQQASKGGEAIIVSEIIRTIMIWLGDRESHLGLAPNDLNRHNVLSIDCLGSIFSENNIERETMGIILRL